jgi:hypothetical protein
MRVKGFREVNELDRSIFFFVLIVVDFIKSFENLENNMLKVKKFLKILFVMYFPLG